MGLLSDLFRGKNWIKNLPKGKHELDKYHWYNVVSPSPWPLLLSMSSLPVVLGIVGCLHGINDCFELLIVSFFSSLFFFIMWNRDIIRESTFIGLHTKQVDANTILGFKLFLFTEIMLFVSFFWAHLYAALYPSVFIGLSWPPVGLKDLLLDPFAIPLTNTVILVYSGFTVTLSHLYLRKGSIFMSAIAMAVTILFGLAFLYIQYTEYSNAEFDISDGIYGSTFYLLTGFHGGHVIIGVSALIITLIRLIELHFSSYSHTGFKLALIYWHFVDVVWLFVFLIVYVLGYDLTYSNVVYYANSDLLGCIVDVDKAFFGKWWKSFPVAREGYWYLNNNTSLQSMRISYFSIMAHKGVNDVIPSWLNLRIYGDYSFKAGLFNKKLSLYTSNENTRFYYLSLIDDQNNLNLNKVKELEQHCYDLYSHYVYKFNAYLKSPFTSFLEWTSQGLVYDEYVDRYDAQDALNFFYTLKILPSALKDAKDIECGLENFNGKIIICSELNKGIINLSLKDYIKEDLYNFTHGIWFKFRINNDPIVPLYVRVLFAKYTGSPTSYPHYMGRDIPNFFRK